MFQSPLKPSNQEADGLGQLKSLLFRGETERLNAIETSVGALNQRVGDAPRLEAATAEVLVEALRRAEVARHRDLAQAIAPVVVAAIQNEIKNSKEMMVEALYPLTGQLVVAAVTAAVRDAMAAINERLDALTSLDRWKLRLRARLTGRPVSELAMAASASPRLIRALFLERGSGELLASWRADQLPEERGELIGGLIAALTGFARDALGDGSGDLRKFDFDGHEIQVRESPTHIIACEFTMPLRAAETASLDQDCFAWLDQFGRDGIAANEVFGAFIERALMRARPAKAKGMGWPMRIVVGLLALAVAALAARAATRAWRDHSLAGALASVIAQRPQLEAYPLAIATDHAAGRVELLGLVPSSADAQALSEGLRAAGGGYEIAPKVGIVATNASLAAEIAAANAAIASLGPRLDALGERVDALRQSAQSGAAVAGEHSTALAEVRAGQGQLARSASDAAAKLALAESRLAELVARADAPRARLAALIDGFAVYFDGRQPLAESSWSARVDAIADLLRDAKLGVRVAGYSDETGNAQRNQLISTQRAEVLADLLAARGVPRAQLSVVGRADSDPIAPSTSGVRERNRRAVLELPYEGEITP